MQKQKFVLKQLFINVRERNIIQIIMSKLTKEDLELLINQQHLTLPSASPIARLYGLATEVLIHLVGWEWVVNNIFGHAPLDEFLRTNSNVNEDEWKYQDRVIELAETLFNFQDVQGIDKRIEEIKKSSIETTVAELQAARMLSLNNTPFYFVIPSNQKGFDYDVIAKVNGNDVACELKCKIETTQFNEKTIESTLNQARRQLPKDKPCIIFLKIPEIWTNQSGTEDRLFNLLEKFFRHTTRVNSVIIHWEEWIFQSKQSARAVRFREETNSRAKFPLGNLMQNVEPNSSVEKWVYFSDLIQQKFGDGGVQRPKPIKALILAAGFTWHAVIKFRSQVNIDEHVIYDIGDISSTRITVLLDLSNRITLKVTDADLNLYEVKTDNSFSKIGLDNFSHLRCQITPINSETELSIAVNNETLCTKLVRLNQQSLLLPNATLGADLESRRNTAFWLARLVIYEKSNSVAENNQIATYFNNTFALK